MKQRHEIIIVGSGPGGSISAVNLLKAGFDVLVIERGDFFRMGELQEYSYKEIKKKYNIPVIEGISVAIKFAESFIDLDLKTSSRNSFAMPRSKKFTGIFKNFEV